MKYRDRKNKKRKVGKNLFITKEINFRFIDRIKLTHRLLESTVGKKIFRQIDLRLIGKKKRKKKKNWTS